MTTIFLSLRICLLILLVLISSSAIVGQQLSKGAISPRNETGDQWEVETSFVPSPPDRSKILKALLINTEDATAVPLGEPELRSSIWHFPTLQPVDPDKNYLFSVKLLVKKSDNTEEEKWQQVEANFRDEPPPATVTKKRAKGSEDADVYISGEVNGARKTKASFSTEIHAEHFRPFSVTSSWWHTPFFKLNASTDPGADPDNLQIGWRFRRIIGKFAGIPGAYFNAKPKIESERDFENTNFIFDNRFTFLPKPFPNNPKKHDGKLKPWKLFPEPFIGIELGKNLRSPLKAAEGDGIARLLAGIDLRFIYTLNRETGRNIDWTNSYTRRWLLTNELSYKTKDDGELELLQFGKSPRDFVESKLTYNFDKFFGIFTSYSWGEVPPSYKLVDHRFRVGFAYKFKFSVER